MTLRERIEQRLVLLDGAMGTEIQRLQPTAEEWDNKAGCSEILNLTAPDKIRAIHAAYYEAGSDIVETNTFGANLIVLADYGLEQQVDEINRTAAQLARQAAEKFSDDKPRYVAGSIGPGTKLPSLDQISYDQLFESYLAQCRGLAAGGVDLFMIETCQDLLQIKAAVNAAKLARSEVKDEIMILVSVTIETTGTMLVGSDINTVITTLAAMDVDILGMNCATGPDRMAPYVKQLSEKFPGYLMLMPNAGMPQNVDGKTVYNLPHEEFGETIAGYIREYGINIAGGCCGTNPAYIKALADATLDLQPASRTAQLPPAVSSLYTVKEIRQQPAPMYIGERANTNGSRRFRELLLAEDWETITEVAVEQEQSGAHTLDLSVAYAGRDEQSDMLEALRRITRQTTLPLVIDSTEPKVMEAALKRYGGRAIINSVNLEKGTAHAARICRLAKQFGAALICLTIDEEGMARKAEKKLAVAERIHRIAVDQCGLSPSDLIFDVLTFSLGTGEEESKDAALQTLEGIRLVKQQLPGVHTVLGVSNISFGLNPKSRKVLNSVFLHKAVEAGLDTAIVNVATILPYHTIDDQLKQAALALINNKPEALAAYIKTFDENPQSEADAAAAEADLPLSERIRQKVIRGSKADLEPLLKEALQNYPALEIINSLLIDAMKEVGVLFGDGRMQLPFVLQSAEVMKTAVDILQPYIEKKDEQVQTSLVLATVRGDVHDIGKNLVDIILSNNGFKVHNIGIKCELSKIMEAVKETDADAIGLSGLLVQSTQIMKEDIAAMKQQGMDKPVLLGGAALTREFVDQQCAPLLESPVVYCKDAFESLRYMSLLKEGNLQQAVHAERATADQKKPALEQFQSGSTVQAPERAAGMTVSPFSGIKQLNEFDLDNLFDRINLNHLFQVRWGYSKKNLTEDEYKQLLESEIKPLYIKLAGKIKEEKIFQPRAVYGYFPCRSSNNRLQVTAADGDSVELIFPKRKSTPEFSIADYFSNEQDLLPLQAVTAGPDAEEAVKQLFNNGDYKNYLLLHGLLVELTEALAETVHELIRQELKIYHPEDTPSAMTGRRYSFGYPCCPDLKGNRLLLQLLEADKIGITISDELQMTPELSTAALVVHNPSARYFSL